MAKRDSFLLRIDPQVLEAVRRWADDDLRSINAHIEYLLRQSLQQAGRICRGTTQPPTQPPPVPLAEPNPRRHNGEG